MKVAVAWLAGALVLGAVLGTALLNDPGYVLIAYGRNAVETTLGFAVLAAIAAYFVVRLVVRTLSTLITSGSSMSAWNFRRRMRGARTQTVQGLLLMAEGRWQDAQKVLTSAAHRSDTPLINYLQAARAADQANDTEARDELLKKAHESTPGSRFAVGLTQAQLQMGKNQWEQALATLLPLHQQAGKHPQVLAMLKNCYIELEAWGELIELLPQLKRRGVVDDDEAVVLSGRSWLGVLAAAPGPERGALWQRAPKSLRTSAAVAGPYAQMLLDSGEADNAESVVLAALRHKWDPSLINLYGRLPVSEPARQLVTAEDWLKNRPSDAQLLLALGRIALKNRHWAKAREYFEASLRLERSPEVYGELGRLCYALGDTERSDQYLARSYVNLPELPMPERAPASAPPDVIAAHS